MAHTPSKTSVQEANKQLSEMFRTMVEQEAAFKSKLAEKDALILELQDKVHEAQARVQSTEESLIWLRAENEGKDRTIVSLTDTLQRIGVLLQHVNVGWTPPTKHEAPAAAAPAIEVSDLSLAGSLDEHGPLDQSGDREMHRELSVITPTTNYSIDGSDGEF